MGYECERELSPLPRFTECERSSFRIVGKTHFKRHVAGVDDDEWYLQNIITSSFIVATTLSKWLKILNKTCDKVTCFVQKYCFRLNITNLATLSERLIICAKCRLRPQKSLGTTLFVLQAGHSSLY